jgi:DNA modification methylase
VAPWQILHGDCRQVLTGIADASIDAVVTDPPYELSFMSRKWDGTGIAYDVGMWREVLRTLKPGGHLLAFGGTRTSHRMVCAIEDAGFEIRDSIHWVYSQGFPKSLDVSKAIDKAAGAEREILGQHTRPDGTIRDASKGGGRGSSLIGSADGVLNTNGAMALITAPATADAARWAGWGTALKPAHESIVMARKPLEGTVAANVSKWGVGGINVDGCRIGGSWARGQYRCDSCVAHAAELARRETPGTRASTVTSDAGPTATAEASNAHSGISKMDIGCSGGRSQAELSDRGDIAISSNIDTRGSDVTGKFPTDSSSTTSTRTSSTIASRTCVSCGATNTGDCITGISSNTPRRQSQATIPALGATGIQNTRPSTPLVNVRDGAVSGRFPSNLLFSHSPACNGQCADGCPVAELDRQSLAAGIHSAGAAKPPGGWESEGGWGFIGAGKHGGARVGDTGTASRFFKVFEGESSFIYVAKPSRAERDAGLDSVSNHPTVKPIELMRYLVRLVTPPGGTVLDPFLGSGSTAAAAILEGMNAIGIEQEAEYVEIARGRIANAETYVKAAVALNDESVKDRFSEKREHAPGQLTLFGKP